MQAGASRPVSFLKSYREVAFFRIWNERLQPTVVADVYNIQNSKDTINNLMPEAENSFHYQ